MHAASSMTPSLPASDDAILYADEVPFLARIAWRQVGALGAVGLAVFAPMLAAFALAA